MNTVEVEVTFRPRKAAQDRGARQTLPPCPPQIPRISRLMALAIKFQGMVDRGEMRDYADLARLGFVTRARMTQIMNLLNLAPDIQEQLLFLTTATGGGACERNTRDIGRLPRWTDQRRRWRQADPRSQGITMGCEWL
jgi:hypothetical protein